MMKHPYLKRILESTALADSFRLVKQKPANLLYIFLFDFLFLSMLFIATTVINLVTPTNLVGASYLAVLLLTFFILVFYFLLSLLIYSFFKYCVLDVIASLNGKTNFSLKQAFRFYGLNLIIYSALIVLILIINAVLNFVFKQNYASLIVSIATLIILFFAYPFVNIMHSFFIAHPELKNKTTIKKTCSAVKNIKIYLPVYLFSICYIGAYILLYYCSYLLITHSLTTLSRIALSLKILSVNFTDFINTDITATTLFTFFVIYLLFVFNRIWFYNVALKIKDGSKK